MAMRMGEGKLEKARQILANCFFLLILFSAILTVLFLLSKDTLLFWFGASEATFPYADTYLTIYTGGTFFALMAMGLNYFITCQGFARIGMFTVVLGALANLILDPIFIFVFDLGVAGAAIATVLSQLLSCIFAVSFLFGKRAPVTISFGNYNRRLMTQILSVGLPPFLILASRQFNSHHPEYRPVQNGRKRSRPAHYCRYDRPELYGYDHRPHAGHQQRNTGYYQLQLRRLPAGSSPPGGEKNPAALPGLHSFHVSGIPPSPGIFCQTLHQGRCCSLRICLGHTHIHPWNYSIKFPVCTCRRSDCYGTHKNSSHPLHLAKRHLHHSRCSPGCSGLRQKFLLRRTAVRSSSAPLFPLQSFFWFLKNIWKSEKRNASQMPDNTKKPLSADHFRT